MSDEFFVQPPEHDPGPQAGGPPVAPTVSTDPPGEVVLTRHARREGRSLAVLQLLRHDHGARVEAQVFARGGEQETRAGPYRLATLGEASNFLAEAVDSLTYLGCEID